MNYGNIKYFDIADGPGVRTTLFVSGCSHHCPGCFQPETWDFDFGQEFTPEVEDRIIESLAPDYVDGLTLLGGEPMEKTNPLGKIKDSRKLLITPHMAWASVEARTRCLEEVYKNIEAFTKGEARNRVDI